MFTTKQNAAIAPMGLREMVSNALLMMIHVHLFHALRGSSALTSGWEIVLDMCVVYALMK